MRTSSSCPLVRRPPLSCKRCCWSRVGWSCTIDGEIMLTAQDVPLKNPAFAWHGGGGHIWWQLLHPLGHALPWQSICAAAAAAAINLLGAGMGSCHSPCTGSSSGTLRCMLSLPYPQLCKLPASRELQACMAELPREQPALSVLCRLKAGVPATGSSCSLKMPACTLADPSALSRPPFVHGAG